MRQISKDEADFLKMYLGDDVCIVTTSRHKNKRQRKRYVEETREVLRSLRLYYDALRGDDE